MILEGMYVRCPIDDEYPELPRRFALGQIIKLNELLQEVTVKFHDLNNQLSMATLYQIKNVQTFLISEVVRCEIYPNFDAQIKGIKKGTVIGTTEQKNNEGYYQYYVQYVESGINSVSVISEEQLQISFAGGNCQPINQLKNYEFHNPVWYHNRKIVSGALHTLKNATFGFETLVGSRVFLMSHQVDTIVRAIGENPCRFMLADEVGLGKTIQAAVIKKGLEQRLGSLNVLIITPESLVYQWKNELSYKFWEDTPVWNQDEVKLPEQVIFPLEKVNTPEGIKVLRAKWDLCIIDETHRLLHLGPEYNIIYRLSKRVNHLLLLSATPIQDRKTEYLKLLKLLQPQKYEDLSNDEFDNLLKKQKYLSGKIHGLVRDLSDYLKDDLAEDYQNELQEISNELNDSILTNLVSDIDIYSEDQGLSIVRLTLAYIAEHYQIERKIIRHRRKELGNKLATRSLETVTYDMRGAEELFYEYETYEKLLNYLDKFDATFTDYRRILLSAMFSSPFALLAVLEERKKGIEVTSDSTTLIAIRTRIHALETTKVIEKEETLVDELINITKLWKKANAIELTRLEELYNDPDLIKGRLMKVVDYVSESVSNKIVIFSAWKETLVEIERVLVKKFSLDSVRSFYYGMTDKELQQSVDDFQMNSSCKFMLCDELGGEGRNFQMADEILHVDLPWSPSMLEQRIGRLDRIGREKEVLSITFISENTVESDLFKLWDDGLNIFNESLSGLEIALGDINEQINKGLTENIRYGLSQVLETIEVSLVEMRKNVEVERYYDMARQLDENVQEQLSALINKFDGNNGELLGKTMMSWAHLAGLNGTSGEDGQVMVFKPERVSLKSMKNTLLIPPFKMQEAHKRAKRIGEVRGTFNRRKAVEREDLIFYAPGDPFFDAIVNNANSSDLGRCCAFHRSNTGINWKGFILTWSVSIDPRFLLERELELENTVFAQGYMPLEQIYTIHGYSEQDQSVSEEAVRTVLQSYDDRIRDEHLGKRSNGRVKEIQELFPNDEWVPRVETAFETSYNDVKHQVSKMIDHNRAEIDFQRRLDGMRAANLYFNKNDMQDIEEIARLTDIYDALLKGLLHPKITLESAAFGWLVE